jgi:hypothetical protein
LIAILQSPSQRSGVSDEDWQCTRPRGYTETIMSNECAEVVVVEACDFRERKSVLNDVSRNAYRCHFVSRTAEIWHHPCITRKSLFHGSGLSTRCDLYLNEGLVLVPLRKRMKVTMWRTGLRFTSREGRDGGGLDCLGGEHCSREPHNVMPLDGTSYPAKSFLHKALWTAIGKNKSAEHAMASTSHASGATTSITDLYRTYWQVKLNATAFSLIILMFIYDKGLISFIKATTRGCFPVLAIRVTSGAISSTQVIGSYSTDSHIDSNIHLT